MQVLVVGVAAGFGPQDGHGDAGGGVPVRVGVLITGALVDRALRRLLLISITMFAVAGVILLAGHRSSVAVLLAIILWGTGYGGAATQLHTAISAAAGPNADIANSILGVAFNVAIFTGGVAAPSSAACDSR